MIFGALPLKLLSYPKNEKITFDYGVASGDPTNSHIILWTKVSKKNRNDIYIKWQVSNDINFEKIIASGSHISSFSDNFTVKVDAEIPQEFNGKKVIEHYYDYDETKKEAQYYDLHHYKIVSVQKYNNMYRWIVNMYIHRKDKSTLFVVQLGSIGINNIFKIVSLNLISRENADIDYLEKGYDEEAINYKYLYEDPNLVCEMPAIFSNRLDSKIKSNCNNVKYNSVSRNRIPDYVTSDEREIREILDARYSSYQGFFRPVRFSFGEIALLNRKEGDDTIPKTNQRFLDRL